jgi:large subunit ribosomal protein L21
MLAVIKTGGKQYLVKPGDKIKVEKLDNEEGKEVTFSEVLLCDTSPSLSTGKNKKIEIGNPFIKGAEVTAKIIRHGKGEKLIIFKYKPKKRYKRKIGHRQQFTEVEIKEIKI